MVRRYLVKLANSGYGQDTRSQILRSATVKYYREILDDRTAGRKMYRSSQEMERARTYKGLEVKTWFKPKRGGAKAGEDKDRPWGMRDRGGGRKEAPDGGPQKKEGEGCVVVETVCFVPFTAGSQLKKQLQEKDDTLGVTLGFPRIRFVERGGTSILDEVGSSSPW